MKSKKPKRVVHPWQLNKWESMDWKRQGYKRTKLGWEKTLSP